jgi:putative sterol carrier protein
MTDVPEVPGSFFRDYIPRRFASVKSGLSGKTSAGSMTFRVEGVGEWSLRLEGGELRVTDGMASDVILQVTVTQADFKPIFVRGAELQEGETLRADQQILAFKVLTVDEERIRLVKSVPGTVAFVVKDGASAHRIVVNPGSAKPNMEQPDCRLECSMSDFMDMQTGKQNPMQLAMAGRIRIIGNAQIPMAMSGVFA